MNITAEQVLQELAAIGMARADHYIQVRGGELAFRDWSELSGEQLAAVAAVEKSSTGLKIKFYDKMKALELMGKILGMFDGTEVQIEENNLLDAILQATVEEVDTNDLPELQQTADGGHDLVEPAGAAGP